MEKVILKDEEAKELAEQINDIVELRQKQMEINKWHHRASEIFIEVHENNNVLETGIRSKATFSYGQHDRELDGFYGPDEPEY